MNVASDEIKKELLSLKKDDLTVTYITKMFGTTATKKDGKIIYTPPHFKQNQIVNLAKDEYINHDPVQTNIGLILFNKLLIEKTIEGLVPNGYWNIPLDKKAFGKLFDIISDGVLYGNISTDTLTSFLKAYEFWGLKLVNVFSPAYTLNMIMPEKDVQAEKDKMFADTPNPSVIDMTKIEDKMIAMSREKLKDDPGMVMYNSGARGDFTNDHKNMVLAVGPVNNPVTGKYDYMKSNYMDGISKEDLVAAGNIIVTSEYPKAVGTQVGGYLTKQFYAVFQSIVLDDHGSDCGTKECIEINFANENIENFYDQYIKTKDGKLVLLTPDNSDQFDGTICQVRSPMFCLGDKICNKCAGERFYKMDILNAGLTTTQISGKILNAGLKSRHNMKTRLDKVDIDDLIV